MPIVSSVTEDVSPQKDGRRYVRERHTDHVGVDHVRIWLANADADLPAALAEYAAVLPGMLRDAEIQKNIDLAKTEGSLAKPYITAVHMTVPEGGAALREYYKTSTEVEAIMIGDYLNTVTDQQLMNAFQITAQQAANLRANKLVPASEKAADIRVETGI
jgi:hypothetical protein